MQAVDDALATPQNLFNITRVVRVGQEKYSQVFFGALWCYPLSHRYFRIVAKSTPPAKTTVLTLA